MPFAKTFELPPLANDPGSIPGAQRADSTAAAGAAPEPAPAGREQPSAASTTPASAAPAAGSAPALSERDIWDTAGCPLWLASLLRLVRPMTVGALLAVPTLGAAACGLTALVDVDTGVGMANASTLFLQGIPGEVYMLIGFFGGGYGLARTVERLRGVRG